MLTIWQLIQISTGFLACGTAMWVVNQVDGLDELFEEKKTEFKKWKYHKIVVALVAVFAVYLAITVSMGIIGCMMNPYCNGSVHIASSNATLELLNGSLK